MAGSSGWVAEDCSSAGLASRSASENPGIYYSAIEGGVGEPPPGAEAYNERIEETTPGAFRPEIQSEMEMQRYHMIKQTLSEARRSFCQTLRKLSSSTGECVVIVHKRGDPIAAILSAAEASEYFAWKAAQLREQEAARDVLDGWPELEDYLKQRCTQRVSRQAVIDSLLKEYGPQLMDPSRAETIVDLVFGEEEDQ